MYGYAENDYIRTLYTKYIHVYTHTHTLYTYIVDTHALYTHIQLVYIYRLDSS